VKLDGLEGLVRRVDVEGSRFRIGAQVLVLVEHESADERFHGRVGEVVGVLDDGHGAAAPQAPLVLVSVEGLGQEWFEIEELHPASEEG
jgi:hypothetical protein